MSNRLHDRALVDRVGAAFATLFFGLQMLVVVKTGHTMPFVPILALIATPFAIAALAGSERSGADERELVAKPVATR